MRDIMAQKRDITSFLLQAYCRKWFYQPGEIKFVHFGGFRKLYLVLPSTPKCVVSY
jgi:hypothetical protein